jgi:hypothetical protein
LIVNTNKINRNYKRGERLIVFAGYFTPTLAASVEWAGKIDQLKHPTISSYLMEMKEYSLFAYGFMIFIFWLGAYWTRKGNKVCWDALQVQIDDLQNIAFSNYQHDTNDSHRVTLFKFKKWNWTRYGLNLIAWFKSTLNKQSPRSGWLVPILRSGHLSKQTKTVFHVPDDGNRAEGIGGKCWASDSVVHVEDLPNLKSVTSAANRDRYSKRSNMPRSLVDQYLDEEKDLSRSLLAIPVRTASGERWGVIVLDSKNPTGVDKIETERAFRAIVSTLGVLLEDVN